ncbi:hypothetical protein B0H63DRAFT_405442 [Podospora didyma]|uniref:Uncharacterized protein n=1 Tax=Podospora didyma TaxID=330526 RepID=A0AAE0JZL6_9PEZI|nr:hypothetical protein B0H63DRAFT_405442 [Podospora didyma]
MMDQSRLATIEKYPTGNGLDAFRTLFRSVCESQNVPPTLDSLLELGYDGTGRGTLRNDLLKINSAVSSDDFDFDRIIPLLSTALAESLNDVLTWVAIVEEMEREQNVFMLQKFVLAIHRRLRKREAEDEAMLEIVMILERIPFSLLLQECHVLCRF